jgi:hypothetical protein
MTVLAGNQMAQHEELTSVLQSLSIEAADDETPAIVSSCSNAI